MHPADESGSRFALRHRLEAGDTVAFSHFHTNKTKVPAAVFSRTVRRPGPKGPTKELIHAVVEMKRRNRTWGCKRIAKQIGLAFGLDIDKDVVRRILGIHSGRKRVPEVRRGFPLLVMPKTRCGRWICFDVNRRCYERTGF